MDKLAQVPQQILADGGIVRLRKILSVDLPAISNHGYSVMITEPHDELTRLTEIYRQGGLWRDTNGAVAIIGKVSDKLIGTLQFFPASPTLHGFEIGYVVHNEEDHGKGYASEGLALLTDYLFATKPDVHRIQLIINTENTASIRVAEKCGFACEGRLRASGLGLETPPDSFVYARVRSL